MLTKCENHLKLLSEYVDGTLPADKAWHVQMHLAVCGDCSTTALELQKTVGLLRSVSPRVLSDSFDAKLAAKVASIPTEDIIPARPEQRWLATLGLHGGRPRLRRRWAFAIAGATAATMVVAELSLQPEHPVATYTAAHSVPARSATVKSSDTAFMAACSSENARYQSNQPLADPLAQTLASTDTGSE
jgi:anti-sigma factor RsiW